METIKEEPDSDGETYSMPCSNKSEKLGVKEEDLPFAFTFVAVKTEVEDERYGTRIDIKDKLDVPIKDSGHSEHIADRSIIQRKKEFAERKRLMEVTESEEIPAKQTCLLDAHIKEEITIQEHGICSETAETSSLMEFASQHSVPLDEGFCAADHNIRQKVGNVEIALLSSLDTQPVSAVVAHFQNKIMNLMNILNTSSSKTSLGRVGEPSRAFFFYLFMKKSLALRFLRTSRLIKSEMQCHKCGQQMELTACLQIDDAEIWECRKSINIVVGGKNLSRQCKVNRSIRHDSWFRHSKLTLLEILLITYEILHRTLPDDIEREYQISDDPRLEWTHFCREVMVDHVETNSQKIGGVCKVVEIYKNKCGKNKYNFRHHTEGQWVVVGVERESEKAFLVVVQNRKPETLVSLIKEWIKPGSRIMTDSWRANDTLGADHCEDLHVNHSVSFIAGESGVNKNTIAAMWRRARLSETCNKQVDMMEFLAQHIFRKHCAASGENIFNKFVEIVRNINWSGQ